MVGEGTERSSRAAVTLEGRALEQNSGVRGSPVWAPVEGDMFIPHGAEAPNLGEQLGKHQNCFLCGPHCSDLRVLKNGHSVTGQEE